MESLKKEYTLIGKRHIKAWHAWLILGLIAGTAAGITLVANRSGKVEGGKAEGRMSSLSQNPNISIELDLPSYFPESLHHPQHIFSGRRLKITASSPADLGSVSVAPEGSRQKMNFPINQPEKEHEGVFKQPYTQTPLSGSAKTFTVDIPETAPTGRYMLSLTINGRVQQTPIDIYGLSNAEKQSASVSSVSPVNAPEISYRTRICDYCFWEMVFGGQPDNVSNLAMSSVGYLLHRSTDGGRRWIAENLNSLTTYPYPLMYYAGDSKIVLSSKGSLFLSGLHGLNLGTTTELGGVLYKGGLIGGLTSSIFQDTPHDEQPTPTIFVDYPKLAAASESTLYIAGFATRQSSDDPPHNAMYISSDGGKTFVSKRYRNDNSDVARITSMAVGADGTLYAADFAPDPGRGKIIRFRSFEPSLEYETFSLPMGMLSKIVVQVSSQSNRGWLVYAGPEVIADTGTASPHRGRLYALWAKEESLIFDPNAEYGYYYYNTDVYASYSDNRGETWSAPVRVNDDTGKGNQMFPSARVDANGTLHVAFVDNRDNQDRAVFDVYYTNSRDGGVSFSKNIRVTDAPTANNPNGGRAIGDYLDMVMGYPDRAYIAYPCGQSENGPTGACMVQITPSSSPSPLPLPSKIRRR